MKKQGSIAEFKQERQEAIVAAFRHLLRTEGACSMGELVKKLVKQPCRRFWVSEERAAWVIGSIESGRTTLEQMGPHKRRMFAEILSRVRERRAVRPCSLIEAVRDVVYSEAPEFYMAPHYAHILLLQGA